MLLLKIANHPFPEIERLRVGIIDPENPNALFDPELNDGLEFLPKRLSMRRVEIEGINVLIFLGRVLGVLDRTVGPVTEPFRMLLDVRMIRRALIGEIECDVDAMAFAGGLTSRRKSSSVPSSG